MTIPTSLRLAQFRFVLRTETTIQLPRNKGSALRGAFGGVFKRMVCLQPPDHPRECDVCPLRRECAYGTVFENALPEGVEPLRGYDHIPHPYVFRPPLDGKRVYLRGDTLEFDLILIGRAIPMAPYFLASFLELGEIGLGRRRGRYNLEAVFGVQLMTGETELIYTEGGGLRDWDGGMTPDTIQRAAAQLQKQMTDDALGVEFITPTRLISGGRRAESLPFSVLARALLRRVSGLCYFHCHQRLEADFTLLVRRAEAVGHRSIGLRWGDWERYSSRQKQRVPMGGLLGRVEYRGEMEPFLPYLLLGTWLHVGKATTFGNGRYCLCAGSTTSH